MGKKSQQKKNGKRLPVEEIVEKGFGLFTVCYNDVTQDDNDFTDGLARLFQNGERMGDDAGKIVY